MSANVIEASKVRFLAEPSAARSAPAVTASLVNGHARLSAGPFNWDADLPPAVGGQNVSPSPTAYLLGALAGCAVVFVHDTLAPELGLRLDEVSAVARCTADARGLLGMAGALPDLGDVAVEIHVVSPEPADRLRRLFEIWQERCPVYLALVKPVPVQATFTTEAGVARSHR
ncbi:OsmC family protein [Streptomyces sp. NPDC019890]|uniref:OsmC family protein n=1 Tax=Streptomyces sp. NPDC019890 TaxID=3365064 RepID=UPI00384E1284